MASNLSTIGFVAEDDAHLAAHLQRCAQNVIDVIDCPAGTYGLWRSRSGAELWFHMIRPDGRDVTEISGYCPFFEGESEVLLKLTERMKRPFDGPFEGLFVGWVAPDDTGEGSYPVVFEAVDSNAVEMIELPAVVTARLSAFARSLVAYPDEAAFLAREGNAFTIAPQAFLPTGLLAQATRGDGDADDATSGNGDAGPPPPTAMLTGIVRSHAIRQNEATGATFHWLMVESYDATFDIVADPEVVSGPIAEGAIVEVTATMFGRLLERQS